MIYDFVHRRNLPIEIFYPFNRIEVRSHIELLSKYNGQYIQKKNEHDLVALIRISMVQIIPIQLQAKHSILNRLKML